MASGRFLQCYTHTPPVGSAEEESFGGGHSKLLLCFGFRQPLSSVKQGQERGC